MIRILLAVVTLTFFLHVRAQDQERDSLLNLVENAPDTTKLKALIRLSQKYMRSEYDLSLAYAKKGESLGREIGDYKTVGRTLFYQSAAHNYKGEFDSAVLTANRGFVQLKAAEDWAWAAGIANEAANAFMDMFQYDSALQQCFKGLEVDENLDTNFGTLQLMNSIAYAHELNENPELAIEWNLRLREMSNQEDIDYWTSVANLNLGNVYDLIGQYDSSLYYKYQALKTVDIESGDYLISLGNIGNTYLKMNQLDSALKYTQWFHEQSKNKVYHKSIRDREVVRSSINLGAVLFKMGRFSESRGYLESGEAAAMKSNYLEKLTEAYEWLYLLNKEQSKFGQALASLEKYQTMRDSVFISERDRNLQNLTVRYETDKINQQLKLLEAENELQDVEVSRTRIVAISLVILLCMLSTLAYLTFTRYKLRKQNELLNQKERDQQRRFTAVIKAEEKERARIARELHDGLGQLLSTVRLGIFDNNDVGKRSAKILDTAIDEVRTISHNMMPAALTNLGLIPAIRQMIRSINDADKMKVESILPDDLPAMSDFQKVSIYRIIQEVVNNSLKYSGASNIRVHFFVNDNFEIIVNDDGTGFDASSIAKSEGSGWKNIQSRIDMLNGKFFIQSDSKGTKVKLIIPINGEAQAITG